MSRTQNILTLIAWTTAIYLLAAIAGIGSANAPEIYPIFDKPDWAPPAQIFGPAWGLLYTLIAVAGWLVWRKHRFNATSLAFSLYAGQLIVNVLWSWLFFAWQDGLLAFVNIVVLVGLIIANMMAFWRLGSTSAALLMAPYLLWVIFAACLNFSIWQMNPTIL